MANDTMFHQQSGQCPVTQTRTDDPSSYTAVSRSTDSPVRCDSTSAAFICHDCIRLSKCSIYIMGQVRLDAPGMICHKLSVV